MLNSRSPALTNPPPTHTADTSLFCFELLDFLKVKQNRDKPSACQKEPVSGAAKKQSQRTKSQTLFCFFPVPDGLFYAHSLRSVKGRACGSKELRNC